VIANLRAHIDARRRPLRRRPARKDPSGCAATMAITRSRRAARTRTQRRAGEPNGWARPETYRLRHPLRRLVQPCRWRRCLAYARWLHADRGLQRPRCSVHDGDYDHNRRLSRGASAQRGGRGIHHQRNCPGCDRLLYTFSVSSRHLEREVERAPELMRLKKSVSDLRDHVIVCGYGRTGSRWSRNARAQTGLHRG